MARSNNDDPTAVIKQLTVNIRKAQARAAADRHNAPLIWSRLATHLVVAARVLHAECDDASDLDIGDLLGRYLHEMRVDGLAAPVAGPHPYPLCDELRAAGLIRRTGERRLSSSGKAAYPSAMTEDGIAYLADLDAEDEGDAPHRASPSPAGALTMPSTIELAEALDGLVAAARQLTDAADAGDLEQAFDDAALALAIAQQFDIAIATEIDRSDRAATRQTLDQAMVRLEDLIYDAEAELALLRGTNEVDE